MSLQSLANNVIYTSLLTLPTARPVLDFPTATSTSDATATATTHTNGKRVSEGEEIGLIVGAAAFLAVSITLGVFYYDVRRKRSIAKQMKAAHEANLAANPRKVGQTPYRVRMSQQSQRWSQHSQRSASGLGGGCGILERDEIQSAPQESYEMQTPGTRE
jgi:hypothetical protein